MHAAGTLPDRADSFGSGNAEVEENHAGTVDVVVARAPRPLLERGTRAERRSWPSPVRNLYCGTRACGRETLPRSIRPGSVCGGGAEIGVGHGCRQGSNYSHRRRRRNGHRFRPPESCCRAKSRLLVAPRRAEPCACNVGPHDSPLVLSFATDRMLPLIMMPMMPMMPMLRLLLLPGASPRCPSWTTSTESPATKARTLSLTLARMACFRQGAPSWPPLP